MTIGSTNQPLSMTNGLMRYFSTERWLYLFVCMHIILWTLAPILTRYNLPLDSVEGAIWGHQLEWGYDKNPFLNGWLTALATYLDGKSGWMIYFFSQISVLVCFLAIWQLARNMLPPVYALISVMILEGVQYYNFHAIDFNDNTLELSLWAVAIYFFYKALRAPSNGSWLLTGLFAGLGMMAKYYTATLLAGMALFLFIYPNNRKQLATLPPYLGLAIFLIIISPHTIWLFFHDFITIKYVFERASSAPSWTNHFFYPAQFAWQQLQAFMPAIILYTLLFVGKKPLLATPKLNIDSFNQSFLLYVGLGPFLLTVLLSILLGTKLRAGWGMPLLSTWGILLITAIAPTITKAKFYGFVTLIFTLMGLLVSGYCITLIHASSTSSANFPGQEIARRLTQQWHDTYHTTLDYVGGSRWISGNIGFYSSDHPAVFIEWNKRRAPWIDSKDILNKGAIFVWDITNGETIPDTIQRHFPTLQKATVMEFFWHRDKKKNLPSIKIGIAFLPPHHNSA